MSDNGSSSNFLNGSDYAFLDNLAAGTAVPGGGSAAAQQLQQQIQQQLSRCICGRDGSRSGGHGCSVNTGKKEVC